MKWLRNETDTALHYNMCFIGGFLGAYALLLRGGNFGSAQTGNLIEAIICGTQGNLAEFLIRLLALLIYGAALVAAYLLSKSYKGDVRPVCIIVEAAGIIIAAVLPGTLNPIVALYPIFCVTAFQWGIFAGAKGYNSATIFSTNNIKQMLLGWTEYIRTKDEKQRAKAAFYTITLVFFHSGVLFGCLAVRLWNVPAVLLCILPLGSALALTKRLTEWWKGIALLNEKSIEPDDEIGLP